MRRYFAILAVVAVTQGLCAGEPALAATVAPAAAGALPQELSAAANAAFLANNAKQKGVIVKPDGLQFKILRNGFGRRPAPTDTVTVYYTGSLINGSVFDGTSQGLPASFKVSQVVPGWIEALQQMREGDHWTVWVPAALGYGSRAMGDAIPPDQTLVFDLTLVSTAPAPKKGEPGYEPDPGDKDDQ